MQAVAKMMMTSRRSPCMTTLSNGDRRVVGCSHLRSKTGNYLGCPGLRAPAIAPDEAGGRATNKQLPMAFSLQPRRSIGVRPRGSSFSMPRVD